MPFQKQQGSSLPLRISYLDLSLHPSKVSNAFIFPFAVERNAKHQEELAQDKELLVEAIKELNSIEEEKYLRYFSLCCQYIL